MSNVVKILRKTKNHSHPKKQLVMFPFGGGSGYSYTSLIPSINPDYEVVVINPPGHFMNEGKPLESIEAMVFLYLKELKNILVDPCAFFGHSIGGIVAYELCKKLEKDLNINIKRLIISSVNPPHRTLDDVDLHSEMDTEQLIMKSTQLGGMADLFQTDPQFLEMFVTGLRADLKALEKYTANPTPAATSPTRLKTPAVILYAKDDYIAGAEKLNEWQDYLDCSEFIPFPGDHFYLFDESNKKEITAVFSKYLD